MTVPNTRKIKGRMAELGLTQKDIAEKLDLSQATVSQKISGSRPLYLDEAQKIAELLCIEDEEFRSFFWAEDCETQKTEEPV